MNKNEISDEKYERIRSHIDDYSFIDLVIWRNEMINGSCINNRLYELIDSEIKKRRIGIQSEDEVKKSK